MSEPTENDQNETDDWAAAMAEQAVSPQSHSASTQGLTSIDAEQSNHAMYGAQTAKASVFQEFSKNSASHHAHHDIDMILDIPVQLTVELGRTKIAIKNLLQLAQGSVVELESMAGEPIDVLVNGCLIAQGEVVVVNDKFGIRLTDIITPSERIRKLNR
jgi:flagellar motor switch protein FliN/FliY